MLEPTEEEKCKSEEVKKEVTEENAAGVSAATDSQTATDVAKKLGGDGDGSEPKDIDSTDVSSKANTKTFKKVFFTSLLLSAIVVLIVEGY